MQVIFLNLKEVVLAANALPDRMRAMLDFCVLGSGSSGNASILRSQNATILIDAGFSGLRLRRKLVEAGVNLNSIDAVLLTHEHTDHTQALGQLLKKADIPVMATRHTCLFLKEKAPNVQWFVFEKSQSFRIGDISVTPFAISHDAVDPVGFRLETSYASLGILSDTGCCNSTIKQHLAGLNALYVESNYDPDMLEATPKRPWPLKQRIASRYGHLSNQQASDFVSQILHPGLRHIILAHLSSESNSELLARETMAAVIANAGLSQSIVLSCARQHEILPWISIG